jgi:tetratricopeptide (TPR) repeat protein
VPANQPKHGYSREEVRRMLGVSERQLRSWERQELIPASAEFGFSDLIALRTLQKLHENRISGRRIGQAITSLKKKLAGIERPLSELKIVSNGRTIAVQVAGQQMEALTGQLLFDFETAELNTLTAMRSTEPSPALREKQAEYWFQRGLDYEERDAPVQKAIGAYETALKLNPAAAGALVNLGTIHFRLRQFEAAEKYYLRAIEGDPRYALARFNLGNLYDELGQPEKAEEWYRSALALDPGYGDAHFNLALLCEKKGEVLRAVHHWRAYLKLDRSSSWADIARRELERLKEATLIRRK